MNMKSSKYFNLALLLFIANTAFAQLPKVSSGTIKRIENFHSKYVAPRNIDVWLPEGYSKNNKYAVLYMHDGQMLFDSTITWNHQEWGVDETMGKLMAENKIKKCIVVGVSNHDILRHNEYFPQKPFESLSKIQQDSIFKAIRIGGQNIFKVDTILSDNYLKFLVTELKPFIDSAFSTLRDQPNTFIAGSSMGGLISMYAICEYPEIFGGAACMSTHWVGTFQAGNNPIPSAFMRYLKGNLPSPANHKIYFDYGDQTLDSLYEPFQMQVDEIMKAKGFTSKNWITRYFPGDDHSEKSWRNRFEIPMLFLLSGVRYN